MITNIFNLNKDLLGINVERIQDNTFIFCVAFKENNNWKAKFLNGISGDLSDEKLINKIIKIGYLLDKDQAIKIFSSLDKNNYFQI